MKGSTADLARSEEGRAFLQRRIALFALILGLVGLGFWIFRAIARLAAGAPQDLVYPNMIAHAAGTAGMFTVWAICRRGELSAQTARALGVAAVAFAGASYGVMVLYMPQAFRPDMTLLLIYALMILARAVLIPSTWQRTARLGVLLGVPLIAVSYYVYRDPEPGFAAGFEGFAPDFEASIAVAVTLNVAMWWIGMAGLATATSAVIYGLRRQMSQAKRLGQYALVRKLGEGGMGVVYEAKHAMLRRPTAVKLLLPERVGEESLARFEREVRATAALSHPNTITVFDYGRTPDGVFYYAMEYLEGGTLGDVVKLEGPMPPGRAVFILHQVAGALAEAHDAGLVHRDVKPDNILLTETGWMADLAKVVDFGLVKELEGGVGVTRDETIVGTPQYMAPEVILGKGTTDPRSDLYAFGAVAYYLVTGRHVFEAKSVVEMCSMHLQEKPVPPSVKVDGLSDELERLVLACLEKKPKKRPETARDIQSQLEALPEFGTWTRADARRWWQQMGPDLESVRHEQSLGTADTLAIDVAQRS